MFLLNKSKIVCQIFLASVIFSSCSFWRTSDDSPKNPNTIAENDLSTRIPFENTEPEIFQAEIVLSSFLNGEKIERIIKAARNGAKMRYDYPNGSSFLQKGENEKFFLDSNKKIYAQSPIGAESLSDGGESLKDLLTTEWLNEKSNVKFENLGAENGLAKYRVKGENENSEVLIYVDENLKLPVKQEFYAINGGQKNLVSAVEIRNFKTQADDSLFEIPKDFKQVSIKEFQTKSRED